MIQRPLLSSLVAFTLLGGAAAQQNEELEFNQRQAKALNAFAKKAFDKGFPRIAKVVWMQVHKLYDPENVEAWTALGYVKIGSSWNPDPKRPYPTTDTGSGADGQPLKSSYESLKKDLANQHRQQADKFAKAGRADRAQHHWRMVLRWVDNDEQAQKALSHVDVGGVSGTELEKTLFDRSKAIMKVVAEQSKTDYGIEDANVKCQPLDVAGVPYVTVQSEHFVLHGDASEKENLKEALRWAERTIAVCKVAFPWEVQFERGRVHWAYFTAEELYKQVLKANKVPDLEWKLEHSKTSGVGNTVVGATSGRQTLFDACVRNVAQGYSGFGSDGFREGIGHTFVGMIFNNNRLFSVDLKKQQGTSASEEDREFTSPDFDVWKNLSLELAWRSTGGVPANKLAFCDASNFSNEERIKAWSFSDYMVRRDPTMLQKMDAIALELQKMRIKQPAEFEKAVQERCQVSLAQLDKEWEDFWTGASPVLKAIQNNTPPLSAISKGVDKWLEAYNTARKQLGKTPVTYSANFSARCKDHAEYLKKNKELKSPADLHTQSIDLGGTYPGSLFAQMALVQPGANIANAKKVLERWIYWPGYRDALLSNGILSVGMYLDGDLLVVNATSGIGAPKASDAGADCYPPRNDTNLIFDGEVPVAELGPEVAELLKANGREGKKTIGFPLTLHFGSTGGVPARGTLQCTVQNQKGEKIEGVLKFDDGVVRTTTAPGMATFWPLEPLKGKISFAWSWMGGDKQQVLRGAFSAK
ncbi:MAG: CAP domain-containing protein [Planctomycetota bacterium]|jgi:hypothetical protein